MTTLVDWCKSYNKTNLLDEWDYVKNTECRPEAVSRGSGKTVWWKCQYGHEWQARVSHRVNDNSGCPYCSGNKVSTGVNDLQTVYPDIAREWHPTRNGELKPGDVACRSGKKVWWKCCFDHEWSTTIKDRTANDTGCPYCSGRKAIKNINDLATVKPEIAKEWHPSKNGELKPTEVSCGSGMKVWWICSNGHEWQATINSRANRKQGCPFCSGHRVNIGENDLQSRFPGVAEEWHPTKNGGLKPTEVSYGSNMNIWWQCREGHEWQAVIHARTTGNHGCPYCSKHRVIAGESDLATLYPDIAKEWHQTRNGELKPAEVSFGCEKNVWWKCDKGHEYQATPYSRTSKHTNCPYCAGKRVLQGFNDLATMNPKLAAEWHPTKNGDLHASEVTCYSKKMVWWICAKGHEWKAVIGNRSSGNQCPYCQNKKVLKGYNDLGTLVPALVEEWNWDKNEGITPSDIVYGSLKRVWWKCQYGHEWKSSVVDRVTKGYKCPKCSGNGTSLPEQGLAFYLEKVCKVEQRAKIVNREIDVYLSEFSIGIEYDGKYYHTQEFRDKEIEKDTAVTENGIRVIRIKESTENRIDQKIIYFKSDYMGANYEWALRRLCSMLVSMTGDKRFGDIEVNVNDDLLRIRERLSLYKRDKNLISVCPEVAQEWHPTKNGGLKPEMFSAGSVTRVWWKCSECDYEWQAAINHRAISKTGCPICNRKKGLYDRDQTYLSKVGSLEDKYPHLVKEWHSTKNGALSPADVTCRSGKKVWWKCSQGHEWQAVISNRTQGVGCPYCSGKRILTGVNDLETINPELAKEWNYEKNVSLKPTEVGRSSKKKVWWKCSECDYEWEAYIYKRARYGTGCPQCAKKNKGKKKTI